MNPDTGHLVNDLSGIDNNHEYLQIPPHLDQSAQLELMGKNETSVGLKSSGSLSRWARKKREARKKLAMADE